MYDIFEKLLSKYGVTAYRVAKETGISTATLTQWKNGTSTPKQDKLQLIADFFSVTIDYLTGNTDRIYCKDCGIAYNPLDERGEKNHSEYHAKWSLAVDKYGFCWNYGKSDLEEYLSMEIINNKDSDNDSLKRAYENLFKAQFSNLLRESDFNLDLDYNSFCAKQLSMYSVNLDNKIPDKVFSELREKYGLDFNYGVLNISDTDSIKKGVKIKVFENIDPDIPLEDITSIAGEEHVSYAAALMGNLYGLKINKDNMAPRISNGDTIIFREQNTVNNGDIVIVSLKKEIQCFKLINSSNGITLISNNPAYEPLFYTYEEIENLPLIIIGKVIENRQRY